MLGVTDIWTYVLGTAAIILLPGPNSIFVLTTSARRGLHRVRHPTGHGLVELTPLAGWVV